MDNNFQKSIIPIDEEESKSWEQLSVTTSNPKDYLVYIDLDGKQHYFHKNNITLF